MIVIENLAYRLADNTTLFENLSFSLNDDEKVALIGKNGIGKSTIFKIIQGELEQYSGKITKNNLNIAYFPQKINNLKFNTVADVFGLEKQILSLEKVENNIANQEDYSILDGFWDCREIIDKKLGMFHVKHSHLDLFNCLSGGERTKLILSSIMNKNTNFLLLDEPTNNMDREGKMQFYDFIEQWDGGIFLISHDRELLNLMEKTIEIVSSRGNGTKIFFYGGNYDEYRKLKNIEENSLKNIYNNNLKNLENQKKSIVKSQQNFIKNKKIGEKALKNGKIDKIGADFKKNYAEKQFGDLVHKINKKYENIENNLSAIKADFEDDKKIYFKFNPNKNLKNKRVLTVENLNFSYGNRKIFDNFNLEIKSGDRIALEGANGSGKTTLLKLIVGEITNFNGNIILNTENFSYIKQNQDFPDEENMLNYMVKNTALKELDCRNILAKFLFRTDEVFKNINGLSGGEKIRFLLANAFALDNLELIILDEPTNNLDIESIEMLEKILTDYKGAILLVSHDEIFKEKININRRIKL